MSMKFIALAALAIGALSPLLAKADDGPALTIDASADRHAISPDIYGMAYPDKALAAELQLPLTRWGGDATTRYNWKIDRTNAGADWFFMAGADGPSVPSGGADAMIAAAHGYHGRVLMTIPVIDYLDSAVQWNCSFPVSLFGQQQKANPYVHPTIDGKRTDAGNGVDPSGKNIELTDAQKLRINIKNTPAYQREWVQHLVGKFGPSARSGTMYELDNEPGGWNNTHRDVHPDQTGDDELVSRSIAYAAAVKSVDPTALIVGPGDFMNHYQSDGKPGDGKKEHDNLGQGDYYLRTFAAYQKQKGVRLLDYFDEHFYPTAQEGQTDDTIIEATRSWWDPTYVEKNWIGKYHGAIALIPTFHKWVDTQYPGTKISISEYGWGDSKKFNDMIGLADVLGIFGRERLDMACLFGPPGPHDTGANVFRIYRNYDGHGGQYGDTWVKSVSDDQGKLSVYGAVRKHDGVLTLMVINKTNGPLASQTTLSHFTPSASAQVFRYSNDNPDAVVTQPEQKVEKTGFTATYPPKSVTLLVLKPAM